MDKNIAFTIACEIVAVVFFGVGGILNLNMGATFLGILCIALSIACLVLTVLYIKKVKSKK